ncbi:membrane-spanning 4-domains subfamily A member 4A-like [Sardina pilchardus]|uniref:membrane-spanning 4-domains subfamily A member 4A-like n=1 Tax=Sardina pilchardus TaxID=27697 RepID=UPI002E0EA442
MASAPSASGYVLVTPQFQQGAQIVTSPQSGIVSPLSSFFKGQPTAMGTVQIMIGVVVFLFGIVTAFYADVLSTFSGIKFWGAIIYITAGALTVSARKQLSPCLVKGSLGMNIVSTITAGISMIMHSIDLVLFSISFHYCYSPYDYGQYGSCTILNSYVSRSMGISGVMIVLSVLEFIVSIYVSAFACKATCSTIVMYVAYGHPYNVFIIT